MTKPIDEVLIVGGGTAGWITAAYLARTLGTAQPGGVKITLIESSEIGIIGVGEGTIPTIQTTMRQIGIDEARFMRGAGAAFKQGIKFVDWVTAPSGGAADHYYHPFTRPHTLGGMDLAPYWMLGCAGDLSFCEAVTLQQAVSAAGKAPKLIDDPQYSSPLGYAYHFDAGKLATLMRDVGKELGVRHLIGNVEGARLDDTGAIAAVVTREHGELTAGLYVDCSGFSAKLIGEAMGVPFIDDGDTLFVNRAVAIQVPYDRPDAPLATTTLSTAHEAGWTWDIGLPDRRGVGYVYSNDHTTDERAEQLLRAYVGPAAEGLNTRQLKLPIGHRQTPWVRNCVAIGLSGGFLEPLEATGIMLIEAAAWMLGRLFPRSGQLEPTAALFNDAMGLRYKGVLDFIKLHYCLSQRTDNDFWIDNTRPESIPDSLLTLLEMWKTRAPDPFDFGTVHDSFEVFNYQYVLYGMGFKTDLGANLSAYPHLEAARREFARLTNAAGRAAAAMPDHRGLLAEIYRDGFRRPAAPGAFQGAVMR